MSKSIVSFEDIWPTLEVAISSLVSTFNAIGWNQD